MEEQKKCSACGAIMVQDGKYCNHCGKPDGSIQYLLNHQSVSVVDIKMPFMSIVTFMVKAAIASIPAIIILVIIGVMVSAFFSSFLLGIFK
ncbi:MAG: hypothetical protein C0399_06895 [Syntrophus sp. (in: bacteria)]|nr:hypothetical protein [Syntrophus sp. (in: bacteria)]